MEAAPTRTRQLGWHGEPPGNMVRRTVQEVQRFRFAKQVKALSARPEWRPIWGPIIGQGRSPAKLLIVANVQSRSSPLGLHGVPTAFWGLRGPAGDAGLLGCGSLTIIQGLYTDAKLSLNGVLFPMKSCVSHVGAASRRSRSGRTSQLFDSCFLAELERVVRGTSEGSPSRTSIRGRRSHSRRPQCR